jgi:uncharacterized protein YlxP (DUF503 family)
MIIGACTLKLMIYESNSLKEKRQIIKSLIGRLKSRYNISIAEIDLNDSWQTSIIGFACVTNHNKHADEMISKVMKFIDGDNRVEILAYNIEIL